MKHIKSYKIFEKKITLVDKKIQLLKDLALDLQDAGLTVEVINGCDFSSIMTYNNYLHLSLWENTKYIVVGIVDENKVLDTIDISNSDIIKEFKETLKSYGMMWRVFISGTYSSHYPRHARFYGKPCCVFKFDKHGKNTNSPLIREVNEKIKRFKDFKKRKKTIIKKMTDASYNFIPIMNRNSPEPSQNISISQINLN